MVEWQWLVTVGLGSFLLGWFVGWLESLSITTRRQVNGYLRRSLMSDKLLLKPEEIKQLIKETGWSIKRAESLNLPSNYRTVAKAQLAEAKQHIGNRLNEPCPNSGDPIYMCPRCVRQLMVELLGKQDLKQKKLDRPELTKREKEWQEHFGELMAKLPEGTPCCGNCAHHRPSVMWHAVTCAKHRGDFAEDILGCLTGERDSGNLWEAEDRPDREKIRKILGFKTCESTPEPLCQGVQISNSQMCTDCQTNQILAKIRKVVEGIDIKNPYYEDTGHYNGFNAGINLLKKAILKAILED